MPDIQLSLVIVLVLATFLAFLAAAYLISKNYIKVSPNAVAVLSGRTR